MSSRISGSSSTIRISCGIVGPQRQNEDGDGAGAIRAIIQYDLPAMVLHDLLHDGKTEAGALRLVSDIRFGELRAVPRRKTDPVIRHRNPHFPLVPANGERDRAG